MLVGTAALVGLLVWVSSKPSKLVYFKDTDVACLPNGHQDLATHIHSKMVITVDGKPESIPANVGIVDNCMSEVHTHDATGEVHVETLTVERLQNMTLQKFFDVWGVSSDRAGYKLEIYFNGELKNTVADVPLVDHGAIELKYTKL